MEQQFKIDIQRGTGSDTVQFHGNIDAHADQYFDDLLRQISANRVIMDFSTTGRINSMGIALLLRSIKSIKVEKKAEVSIKGLNQINTMLFKMTGIFQLASNARTA
jgi:anti-anti-sigma regulatory factor